MRSKGLGDGRVDDIGLELDIGTVGGKIGGCEERADFEEAGGKEGLRKLADDCLYFEIGAGWVMYAAAAATAGEGTSSCIAGVSSDWGLLLESIRVIGWALAREKLGEYWELVIVEID